MAIFKKYREERAAKKALINYDQWNNGTSFNNIGYSPMFVGNELFSTYLGIYRNSLPVRSVVSFLSDNTASIPLKVYRKMDADIREALDDHALALTLKSPNPEDTTHTWMRDLSTDLNLFDCTFYKKIRVASKLLLVRCFPDAMVPEGGNSLAPETWKELQRDGTYKDYKRDDIFWLHGFGGYSGVSPMETLRREMELDKAESDYRLKASKTGWRTAGVIERPSVAGEWSDKARMNFLEGISARYSGEGVMAGKPLLLEEDMRWTSDAQKDGSAEYVAARIFSIKQVCLAFHMTPQILGVEGAPYSSIVEYKNQMYQGILAPKLDFLEQAMEKWLLPEFDDVENVYVEFNLNAKLRGDPAQQASIAQGAVGGPYMSPNEWRAQVLNMPPIEGGDKLILPGGSPAPAGPTADAGTPPSTNLPAPSDMTLSPIAPISAWSDDSIATKSSIQNGDELVNAREAFRDRTTASLTQLFNRMESEYRMSGELDKTKWVKELAGEIQLQALAVSRAVGEYTAGRVGADYNTAQTVNYWAKASKDWAQATLDQLEVALKETEDAEVFSIAKMQVELATNTILTRASGWAVMEVARQTGVI